VNQHQPVYLSRDEVLELHDRIIGLYGGMPGVRDEGALESCLAQPQTAVFGCEPFPSLHEKAAAYCYFIVRNHPFFDGNKRAGFIAALHFLLVNDVIPRFNEDRLYDTILAVAQGEAGVTELVAAFQASGSSALE
jgi:death-on-curing protein